ncbi:MAG: Gfo/Idh/MocA family oxidoreductase [Micropruina sp.]|nr:Gfo/Idh/MocA family oxidoreductase [Micropruina sp.]
MSERPQLTAAVVGLGDISAVHLDAIQRNPAVRLVGVCDIDPERARRVGTQLGVPAYAEHRRLLDEVRPDVLHVTTPHHQHVPLALDAIDAGVNVLTEKPVAHTVADGERLAERARQADVSVGVVLQNRYNPTSVAIRETLRSGALGTIQGARASLWWSRTPAYYASSPWRGRWAEAGGGVLINQAIHTLDLLLWLLGDPVNVRGTAATLALADLIEVEDTATLVIDHAGGARSVLFATNTHHTNADVELEISGSNGTLALVEGRAMLTDGAGTRMLATDARDDGERSYWGMSHAALIDDFYAQLAKGAPFWLTPEVGLPALRTLRSAYLQSGLLPAGTPL